MSCNKLLVLLCVQAIFIVCLLFALNIQLRPISEEKLDPLVLKHNKRYALVAMCFDAGYVRAALTVGYSHKKTNSIGERLLLIPNNTLSLQHREALSTLWNLSIIQLVPSPKPPDNPRWKDQFTKLLIWNYTEFAKIIYIDLDTIILKNMDELFFLPSHIPLAAVGSFRDGKFNDGFGAGFLVLSPNQTSLTRMLADKNRITEYEYKMMDQGFLNWWFRFEMYRLPPKYCANLAIYYSDRSNWDRISGVKAIHYTVSKPHTFSEATWDSKKKEPVFAVWKELYDEAVLLLNITF